MNLYEATPWQKPLFLQRVIMPFLPFFAAAVFAVAFTGLHDLMAHQQLEVAQRQIPTTNLAVEQTEALAKYNRYRDLLVALYANQNSTLAGLRGLRDLAQVLPPSMRLASVQFDPANPQMLAIKAEVGSPRPDVDNFLTNVATRHWQFTVTSLTPSQINQNYELDGTFTTTMPNAASRTAARPNHRAATGTASPLARRSLKIKPPARNVRPAGTHSDLGSDRAVPGQRSINKHSTSHVTAIGGPRAPALAKAPPPRKIRPRKR